MVKKNRLQTIIFDNNIFKNKVMIRTWIKNNNYIIDKRLKQSIMKFDKSFRVRQRNPDWFKKKTFKLKVMDKGVNGLYGNLK